MPSVRHDELLGGAALLDPTNICLFGILGEAQKRRAGPGWDKDALLLPKKERIRKEEQ